MDKQRRDEILRKLARRVEEILESTGPFTEVEERLREMVTDLATPEPNGSAKISST